MSLFPEVSFVSLALQTQQRINDSYMRKMNRDYAAHIPNPETSSIIQIPIRSTIPSDKENSFEQESS